MEYRKATFCVCKICAILENTASQLCDYYLCVFISQVSWILIREGLEFLPCSFISVLGLLVMWWNRYSRANFLKALEWNCGLLSVTTSSGIGCLEKMFLDWSITDPAKVFTNLATVLLEIWSITPQWWSMWTSSIQTDPFLPSAMANSESEMVS